MKPLLISYSDFQGGAARAAYRLHRGLLGRNIDSRMQVRARLSGDASVQGPGSAMERIINRLRPAGGDLVMRLQQSPDANVRSGNWLPSKLAGEIDESANDVVNLHWVGAETLSIEDIGRIRKPLVWTLHDMWPFCGAEHYAPADVAARWRTGYSSGNRAHGSGGVDLDRFVWQRKRRAWRRLMHIVAPSRWLAECADQSVLFEGWPLTVIPNVLDTTTFQPLDRNFSRQALGLPFDQKIILFGAAGDGRDPRKGYDLLLDALSQLDGRDMLCVVFGQSAPPAPPVLPCPVRWMGYVHDDATLALLYSAADVMVVPSRQENLPQTATEPQACGCPVVAFDCSGLPDVVVHLETGYLAKAFDAMDLATGIQWVLEDAARRAELGRAARMRALRLWAPEMVVPQYLQVYAEAIDRQGTPR